MATTKTSFSAENPGPGRPKGTPNKFTSEIKQRIENVLDVLDETLEEDLRKIEPGRRVELWAQLQEYIRPKLSRTTLAGDSDNPLRGVVQVEVKGTVRPPTTSEKDVSE
jgi:hypothetical protein